MKLCPVHGQMVALDTDGHLLGRCEGCMEEAADALILIQSGVASARAWAQQTLTARARRFG